MAANPLAANRMAANRRGGPSPLALVAAARTASPQAVSTAAPPADVPRIIARLDSGTVAVGDPVTLRILLRLPASSHLADATPFFRDPLPPGVRLIRADSVRTAAAGTRTATITVVLFRPGTTQLPPIAVAYRPASGAPPDTARTAPMDCHRDTARDRRIRDPA